MKTNEKDKILETHKQLQKLYDVIYLIKDKEERAIISNLFQDLSDKLLDNQRWIYENKWSSKISRRPEQAF